MAIREMTNAEKEKLVNNIEVDTSEISTNPKDNFIQGLIEYSESMHQQVEKLKSDIIPSTIKIIDCLVELNKKLNSPTIQGEITTHNKMLEDAKLSLSIMEGRLSFADSVIKFCGKSYTDLVKFDFFIKGAIGLEEAKSLAFSFAEKKGS